MSNFGRYKPLVMDPTKAAKQTATKAGVKQTPETKKDSKSRGTPILPDEFNMKPRYLTEEEDRDWPVLASTDDMNDPGTPKSSETKDVKHATETKKDSINTPGFKTPILPGQDYDDSVHMDDPRVQQASEDLLNQPVLATTDWMPAVVDNIFKGFDPKTTKHYVQVIKMALDTRILEEASKGPQGSEIATYRDVLIEVNDLFKKQISKLDTTPEIIRQLNKIADGYENQINILTKELFSEINEEEAKQAPRFKMG